jgi:hypothetical protein
MHVDGARAVFAVGAIGNLVALHIRSAPVVAAAHAHSPRLPFIQHTATKVNDFEKSQF